MPKISGIGFSVFSYDENLVSIGVVFLLGTFLELGIVFESRSGVGASLSMATSIIDLRTGHLLTLMGFVLGAAHPNIF